MRSICKKGSVTLVAVLALCVVASASASAAEWYVGGKALTGSSALAKTTKVEESISLTMLNGTTKITCTSATLYESGKESLAIIAPGSLRQGMVLAGCKMTAPAKCEVESEIETGPLTATLTKGTSPEDSVLLKGTSGKAMMELVISGTCIEAGAHSLAGSFTLLAPTGQNELAEQTLVGQGSKESPAGSTLWSDPVYLSGKLKLKLASGGLWSFR